MPDPSTLDAPNLTFNFPQDFLDAFEASRGLCPANPEGDAGFMWFLYVFGQMYAGSHVFAPATLTAIDPSTLPAGGSDFTLTLTGTGLVPGSTVLFGSATQKLNYISDSEGTITVNASEYAQPGTLPVTVQAPGGVAASNAIDFVAT